ncbi:MAG TPA: methionine synthase [Actinomycetota bacterium]|nr:methionine synthase [Actinomycetota bacterium]
MTGFLEALKERVLIFDGAMGTSIHAAGVSADDYRGEDGNSEVLTLSRPELIQSIHASYFEAGSDIVETNTFGANKVAQGEYDAEDRVYDLNLTAARLAREAADGFTDRPRWVAGSIGPGTKSPIRGEVSFDFLEDSYNTQIQGLMDGGADVLIIETCFDILQCKSAVAAAMRAFEEKKKKLPLIVQVTIETVGTMLWGTEIGAALTVLEAYPAIDIVGINCATGPAEMIEHVRYLTKHSRKPVSVQPNAGMPKVRGGATHFPLTPEEFVRHHKIFVEELGASIVGGCCGTTPEHLRQLVEAVHGAPAPVREPDFDPGAASLYTDQPFAQETSYFIIGERINAQGSRKAKELIEQGDLDGVVELAKDQVKEGAHALDVMPDITGRNGIEDVEAIVGLLRTQSTLPLVIDSTEPEVVEAALKLIGGRAVINSINLEEGTGPDSRLMRNLRSARKYGAAVVAGAIEEKGQATTADWKLDVCKRILEICIANGLEAHDILWDPLVLPISTGQEENRRFAIETLDAIERLKKELPETFTTGGISNVSFGLSPPARVVLNSVFLHEAVQRGLDSAIAHSGRILPVARIPEEQREAALDLIYDRRREGFDPLQNYLKVFEGVEGTASVAKEDLSALPLDERLAKRVVNGEKKGLEQDLEAALEKWPPLEIVNNFLMQGMGVVSDLFGSGQMQLPFVLQSAETMKAAVAYLEPHMEKSDVTGKGKIVLGTVSGDVHDIGKNLVDIILTNNGYTVHNIGIRQPLSNFLEVAAREKADVIGMSGLLVKSTLVMRENLEELNRQSLDSYPVILGGAALNRAYVEDDLRSVYKGSVFYGKDAFEGLSVMDSLMKAKRGEAPAPESAVKRKRTKRVARERKEIPARSDVALDAPIPEPPFWGSRVVKGIAVQEVAEYLNKDVALFRGQWQYKRKPDQSAQEYRDYLKSEIEPILRTLLDQSITEQILQPAVVYGYFPAQSDGDDLIVYKEDRKTEWVRFTFPRQRSGKFLCISDFFRPISSEEMDVVAFHLVTMGRRVSEVAHELFTDDKYTDYLHLHGLSVEMAEALAELWHKRIREELGFGQEDAKTPKALFRQGYRGSRYSFGYPACPNLEDQQQIMKLLDPSRIGVILNEEFQLEPEQSTSAIIAHHPEARYFSVGRLD